MMVSIIVPVYNTGKYVRECIESVIQQSYQDWELLLMDDGSTDDSGEICDEYASSDSRIKVVHKLNTGVSDTRNKALDLAVGKYVVFLDSDDYWKNNSFLKSFILHAQEYNIDVLRGEYVEVDVCGNEMKTSPYVSHRLIYEKTIVDNLTFIENIVCGEYFSVLCLYRKEYLSELRFNINRIFLEDAEFYLSFLPKKGLFSYISNEFYAYRKHSDAVSVRYVPQKMKDAFDYSRFCYQQMNKVEQFEYKRFYAKEGVQNYIYDVSQISDAVCKSHSLLYWKEEYNLDELRRNMISMVIKYNLFKFSFVILPLGLLMWCYHIRHQFKHVINSLFYERKTDNSNSPIAT